jgi:hypothetical protein
MDLVCCFGMMFSVGSNLCRSYFQNYSLLLVARMYGWRIICNFRMETFIGILYLLVHDWEVELVSGFFEMLYSQRVRLEGENTIC